MRTKDHVLGVVHVRSLINIKDSEKENFDMRSRMSPIMVVPESMDISKVLQTMQQKRVQLVVVADEYGGTAGLVTMEDLLEEIVGDIQDEHDADKEEEVVHRADGTYEFDGMTILPTFCILNLKSRKKIPSAGWCSVYWNASLNQAIKLR